MDGNVFHTTCTYPPSPPRSGACAPASGYPGGKTQSIHNPPVPFVTPISGGILPGKKIFISGVLNPNAQRFTVNLICGPHDGGGDIAFHFDVRIRVGGQRDVIVRNSCQGGGWGAEERHSPCFPFVPNAKFDIKIKTKPGKFKIAVNKQHLLEFRHRMKPLDRINTLQILGDLRLTEVRL
ncbi:galectin-5-like isoform X2 [Ostrea edulis]|uniref:galectin-5-like isoform X2 n=1 Tax=Ostrea edulis TaxID=37623 RepID=UPI0020961641|nr:galectin-5-like isoform X2 [Ostrea edulis]